MMHEAMKIKARHLASGDRVKFPRLGWRRIERITGASSFMVAFLFDDRKIHQLDPEKQVEAERRTDKPAPRGGEILRLDLETMRVSVVSPSLTGFSSEISDSFKTFGRVSSFPDSAARGEILYRGATLFTAKAVYWRASL